ncbi:MAG: hypothetical protein B7Y25_07530 [Alphaproteobacteria bacterium 16-39-46]|nr:MAG: hypothetical protein B7Y25_07530 [Alphaproteobacteria bacterium 16-39-46]OZA41607.1 MAG: hypothetical protein B7X84_07695 [Alphaproteobacteria bacterium 17-39-52]HQS84764.1 hypothetical protein [Alphaproteobacteria bacterium]HQS94579.1 hypothetical protein [Alphaproteobacteria bacterium]
MIIGFIKKELVVFTVGMLFSVISQVWGMDYEIERHAQSFLGRYWNPEKKREIVDALKVIPSSDLESVVVNVHSLRTYMNKSSKVGLIRTVAQMPSHERSSLCREICQILQILGPEQTQEQYHGVISYVRETPLVSREGLSDCLKQLNFVSSHGWYGLLEAIKEIEGIPQHERRDFADLVGSFRFERELIEGIRHLKSFSHQERRSFKDFALSFLDGILNFRNKLVLIKEVQDIPQHERRDFSDLVRFFRFESGLIEGIRCLKSLSHQERGPFKDLTGPFLEKLPDIKNKLEFIREIKDVPQDERRDFADLVGSFHFDNDLMEGIRSLKSIPPQARRPFKDFALPLIETLTNIKNRSFIINWLLDIPLDERETIFSTLNKLSPVLLEFNRLRELSGVIDLINFVRELSREERITTEWGSFSSYVLPFLSLGDSSRDKKSILKKLYSLPQSERDPFKELVFSFLNLRSEDFGKFSVIEAFIEVLPQERENIALLLRHVTPHLSDRHLTDFLRDLTKLSEESEREKFVKIIMAFTYDSGLLKVFQKISSSEISEVEACLSSLREFFNSPEKVNKRSSSVPSSRFLEDLISIPVGMRLEVQEFSLFLFQHFFKTSDSLSVEREIIEILKYGTLFSSVQRVSFQRCLPFFEIHDFKKGKEIMEALKKSPLEDQESVARHVSTLIKEKSSSYGFDKVFEDVRETPPEHRERAIRNSRDFLVKSASRWEDENRKIYRSLRFFPEEGLSILQKTLERLIPETSGRSKDRIMIMERLAKVPPHHMESVGNCILSLSWPEIKGEEKCALIEAISKIPPEEREGLFKTFQGLSELNFTSQQKLEILGFFQETSDQELKSLIELTKPFIITLKRGVKQFSQKAFVPFLKVFKGISPEERDHFQSSVLKIINTSRGEPENKLSLAKTVSKMASHEWDDIAEIALSILKKIQGEEAFLEDPEESEEDRDVEDVRSHYRRDPDGDAFYKMRDWSRYGQYLPGASYTDWCSDWDGHGRYEQEHYEDYSHEKDYDYYERDASESSSHYYTNSYQRRPEKTLPKPEEEKEDSRNPLLESFWGIPPSDRDLVRCYVHSLIAPYMTLKDILSLIENVRDISPRDRETIHPSLLSLLEASERTTTEIINFMKTLSCMKKSEQENITHHTLLLLKMIKRKEEVRSFSRMLDFCEDSLQNLFSEDGSISHIEASAEIPAEEDFEALANDFEQSHSLKVRDKRHNYPKTYTLSAVVEAFSKIPLKDRDDVCYRTQAMAESFIEGKDLGALIEIVQVILPEKRAVTQRLLSKLVKCSFQMSPSDFLESAKVLGNLSCDDQESVMDQVVSFLKTTCLLTRQNQRSFHLWNEGKKSPLLVAFSKISVSDREDLNTYLRSLLPLLTNPFDVPEIERLIVFLGTVTQDNRIFVQPHLLKLSQISQISSKDLRDLIRVLRVLPPEEKENLAEQGMAFVTKRILEEAFSPPISSREDQKKKVYSKWHYLFGTLTRFSTFHGVKI